MKGHHIALAIPSLVVLNQGVTGVPIETASQDSKLEIQHGDWKILLEQGAPANEGHGIGGSQSQPDKIWGGNQQTNQPQSQPLGGQKYVTLTLPGPIGHSAPTPVTRYAEPGCDRCYGTVLQYQAADHPYTTVTAPGEGPYPTVSTSHPECDACSGTVYIYEPQQPKGGFPQPPAVTVTMSGAHPNGPRVTLSPLRYLDAQTVVCGTKGFEKQFATYYADGANDQSVSRTVLPEQRNAHPIVIYGDPGNNSSGNLRPCDHCRNQPPPPDRIPLPPFQPGMPSIVVNVKAGNNNGNNKIKAGNGVTSNASSTGGNSTNNLDNNSNSGGNTLNNDSESNGNTTSITHGGKNISNSGGNKINTSSTGGNSTSNSGGNDLSSVSNGGNSTNTLQGANNALNSTLEGANNSNNLNSTLQGANNSNKLNSTLQVANNTNTLEGANNTNGLNSTLTGANSSSALNSTNSLNGANSTNSLEGGNTNGTAVSSGGNTSSNGTALVNGGNTNGTAVSSGGNTSSNGGNSTSSTSGGDSSSTGGNTSSNGGNSTSTSDGGQSNSSGNDASSTSSASASNNGTFFNGYPPLFLRNCTNSTTPPFEFFPCYTLDFFPGRFPLPPLPPPPPPPNNTDTSGTEPARRSFTDVFDETI